jgi:uncharacterized protein (DUF2336 family)
MSEINSEHLIELARHKSAENRKALGKSIGELFARRYADLSDRERSLVFEILHNVVLDVEMSVRKSISEQLAEVSDAPRALIKFLANDEFEVAYPVLTRSSVLEDDDLIEVIQNRTLEHQLAVANRYSVSELVSSTLVSTGRATVIETLLRNENARISQSTMAYLVDESKRVNSFREPILRRSELGPELAKRMFLWVSEALRQFIIEHFALDATTIEDLLKKATSEQIEVLSDGDGESGSEMLADNLAQAKMINEEMLVDAMAQGEINLFVALLGRITELRRNVIMRLLFEAGGEGLAIACKAVDIGRDTFCALLELSGKTRRQSSAGRKRPDGKALVLFDSVPRECATNILKKWQRHPDHVNVIADLKLEIRRHG